MGDLHHTEQSEKTRLWYHMWVIISAAWLATCMTLTNLHNYTEPFFIYKNAHLFLVKILMALVDAFNPVQENWSCEDMVGF